jgi:hydroxymethylbilane synthase
MNHGPTALAVAAERGAMVALEGSCRTAVGAHGVIEGDTLTLTTEMLAPDGSARWRRSGEISGLGTVDAMDRARALGLQLGREVHRAAGDQDVSV